MIIKSLNNIDSYDVMRYIKMKLVSYKLKWHLQNKTYEARIMEDMYVQIRDH